MSPVAPRTKKILCVHRCLPSIYMFLSCHNSETTDGRLLIFSGNDGHSGIVTFGVSLQSDSWLGHQRAKTENTKIFITP
jgi:hypothetical protein